MSRPVERSRSEHPIPPRHQRLVGTDQVTARRAGAREDRRARWRAGHLCRRLARAPLRGDPPASLEEAGSDRDVPRGGGTNGASDSSLRRGVGGVARAATRPPGEARAPAVRSGWTDRCNRASERARTRHRERPRLPPIRGTHGPGLDPLRASKPDPEVRSLVLDLQPPDNAVRWTARVGQKPGARRRDQAQPKRGTKHRQNANSSANPAIHGGADGTRTYNLRL